MAEEDIQRLVVNIEARMAQYEKSMAKVGKLTKDTMGGVGKDVDANLKKAEKRAEQAGERLRESLSKAFGGAKKGLLSNFEGSSERVGLLSETIGGLGPAGMTAAAGLSVLVVAFGALYTKGKEALETADAVANMAEKLGISAEHLQEIRAVFTGLAKPEEVDAGLVHFNEQLGLASAGAIKSSKIFKALKIDIRDAVTGNVKDPSAVFLEAADKISNLKSPAQQAAAAQKLFGDSGVHMLPILREGSAAIEELTQHYRDIGAIMSNETIAKGADLQKQMEGLNLVIRAQLTTALVEAGPEIVQLTQWFALHLPQAIQITTKVVQFLADNLKTLVTVFSAMAGWQIGGVLGAAIGLLTPLGPLGAVIGAIAGAAIVGTGAFVAYGAAADSAASLVGGATKTITAAEQQHIDKLNDLRDIYDEIKTASADRVKSLEAEGKAEIDRATAGPIAAAQAELDKRKAATAAATADKPPVFDNMGNATGFTDDAAEGIGQKAAEKVQAQQQAVVDALIKGRDEMIAALSGTEKIFDPVTAGVDELVAHLGRINPIQITETQAAMVSANQSVKDLVATVNEAPASIADLQSQYSVMIAELASVTGWDTAGASMANFIQGVKDIEQQLADGQITTDQAAARFKHLMDLFGVPVSAQQIVDEIGRIEGALQSMGAKATAAFATLGQKLGNALRTFALGGGGEVVPDNAGIPRPRGTPPAPRRASVVSDAELGNLGKGGGAGKAAKTPAPPKLDEYLKQLQTEVDRLALSGIALKENQLQTEALAKAKEDFRAKNKHATEAMVDEVKLSDQVTAKLKEQARILEGVPAILKLAADKLPKFNLATQLKTLTELQGLLTDPAVVKQLEAQGLSAEDAGRAIRAQIAEVKAEADGTTAAITGIGDAFTNGIQGATSFADAVTKIGIAIAQMIVQAAAFGNTKSGGPLGGVFDNIFGTIGGLAGLLGGGGAGGVLPGGTPLGLGGIGHAAGGADLRSGQATIINELGREAASRGGDLFIPGKAASIIPADAARSAGGRAANANAPPINFYISMAGANGDQTIMAIAAAAVKQGLKSVPEINRQHTIRFAG